MLQDDHGDMLLPDLAKEIEQKLNDNSSSIRTQINLDPSSTQVGTLLVQTIFGLRNSSSAYQRMIESIYSSHEASLDQNLHVKNSSATASWEAPVFDVYSDSESHLMTIWTLSLMCWQSSKSSPAMVTHLQNYSIAFEKLPASMTYHSSTVPPLHPYVKLDLGELN